MSAPATKANPLDGVVAVESSSNNNNNLSTSGSPIARYRSPFNLNRSRGPGEDHEELKDDIGAKKREVFQFKTNWLISSVAWSNEAGEPMQLALSSYLEEYSNHVQLVSLARDASDQEIHSICTFEHPYPATKILWIPRPDSSQPGEQQLPRLLATSADYLRIWRLEEKKEANSSPRQDVIGGGCGGGEGDQQQEQEQMEVKLECLLNSNQGSKLCAPLTSFDWSDTDPRRIVASSVDTTCAVWDLETSNMIGRTSETSGHVSGALRTQLVAHDHQVYDVSFSRSGSGRDVFASVSGDGSVRLFDLRRLSTSSVLLETDYDRATLKRRALVRVCCSKRDANLLSAFAIDSNQLLIIDIRKPGRPLSSLGSHSASLNGMSWAPHSAHHICSAADDGQALIWELSKLPERIEGPLLAYRASGKINAISWSCSQPDWIAIGHQENLELLRV